MKMTKEYVNKIINTDILEFIPFLENNSIDAIITSPPYNYNREYDNYNDSLSSFQHLEFLTTVFSSLFNKLKVGGRLIINLMPNYKDYFPLHVYLINSLLNNGYLFRNEIIWNKNNYGCKYTTWGSWCKPSAPYMKVTWEYVYVLCKGTRVKKKERGESDLSPDEFKEWTKAMWNVAPEREMKKWGHPAMFPEELVRRLIKLFTWKNDLILDPFNGVGTTTKVAAELGRRFIGVDISEKYCLKALRRTGEVFPEVIYFPNIQSFVRGDRDEQEE